MKALPLFLAASLAANAAWVAGALLHDRPADTANASRTNAPASPAANGAAPAQRTTDADSRIAAALNTNDPEQLRDALRAAGIEDELVRQLVGMRIWKKYEPRFKALRGDHTPDPAIWWKNPEQQRHSHQTKEQREATRALQKQVADETKALLGEPETPPTNPWLERQYGFLTPEKRKLLQQTEQDYNELMGEIHGETQGIQLPSDREKLRFLEQEKRRDMEALLTPEELHAYELRNSPTAQQLRWKMTLMDATEEEYRQIYALQKDFDAIHNPHDPFGPQPQRGPNYWKERQADEKALNARIRETIGEERYAEYLLGNDHGYQQLKALTQRLALPADTPRQLYALRNEIPAAAQIAADDPALTYDQKRARLNALADQAREALRTRLGDEGAEAVLTNGSFNWIKQLTEGTITTFDENGGQNSKQLPKPKPPKTTTSNTTGSLPVVRVQSH